MCLTCIALNIDKVLEIGFGYSAHLNCPVCLEYLVLIAVVKEAHEGPSVGSIPWGANCWPALLCGSTGKRRKSCCQGERCMQ